MESISMIKIFSVKITGWMFQFFIRTTHYLYNIYGMGIYTAQYKNIEMYKWNILCINNAPLKYMYAYLHIHTYIKNFLLVKCQTLKGVFKYSLFLFLFLFLLFRATLMAYGSSQARAQIRATAACLHHRRGNALSKPGHWILNPLSKARDQTRIL